LAVVLNGLPGRFDGLPDVLNGLVDVFA